MEELSIPRVNRFKTSIYFDKVLWKDFVTWCKSRGTSTCHILEPLVYALLNGTANLSPWTPLPKIEMNLSIHREVLRARRREGVGAGPIVSELGSHLKCYFCAREAKYMVYWSASFDVTTRIFACGYHRRRYLRMTNKQEGYPKVLIESIYTV